MFELGDTDLEMLSEGQHRPMQHRNHSQKGALIPSKRLLCGGVLSQTSKRGLPSFVPDPLICGAITMIMIHPHAIDFHEGADGMTKGEVCRCHRIVKGSRSLIDR